MLRSYEFYERHLNLKSYEIDKIARIIEDVENGIYNEDEIRSLEADGLKFCICEGKYEIFEKLVSPFEYQDGDKVGYKYLLDAITLGIVEYINSLPRSIMEHWVMENKKQRENADFTKEESSMLLPVEFTARDAVIMYPSLKEELLDAIFKVDRKKIMSIKIKDVLARQICGTAFPIKSSRDVFYYAELPLLYPCLDLFKKNIITRSNDTGGCYSDYVTDESEVFITNLIVNYDCLDEANKMVADALIENGNAHIYKNTFNPIAINELVIEVPCRRNENVYQVTKRMMELVSKFSKQDMIYGLVTVDDIYEAFCSFYRFLTEENQKKVVDILENGYTSENILKALEYFVYLNYYYDSEEDKFWIDEFYYRKHKEYVEGLEFGSQGLM